jgi:hypothetical protein
MPELWEGAAARRKHGEEKIQMVCLTLVYTECAGYGRSTTSFGNGKYLKLCATAESFLHCFAS